MKRWRKWEWTRNTIVSVVSVCLVLLPWLTVTSPAYADRIIDEADKGRRTGANLLLNYANPSVVNESPLGAMAPGEVNLQELFPGYNDPSQHTSLQDMGADPTTLSTQGIATQMALQGGSDINAEGYQALRDASVNPNSALMNAPAELLITRTRPLLAGTDPLLDTLVTGCVADVTAGTPAADTTRHLEDIWGCTQARTETLDTCTVERAYALNPVETRRIFEIQSHAGAGAEHWADFDGAPIAGEVGLCRARRQEPFENELYTDYPPGPYFHIYRRFEIAPGEPGVDLELIWVSQYCGTHSGRTPAEIASACEASGQAIEGNCRNTVQWQAGMAPPTIGTIMNFTVPGPGSGNCSPLFSAFPYDYTGCPAGRQATCETARDMHIAACMGSAVELTGTETITASGLGSGTPVTIPDQDLFGVTVDIIENGFNPGAHGLMAGDYVIADHVAGGTGIVDWSLDHGGSYGSNWDYTFTVTLEDSDEFYVEATLYEIVDNGFVFNGCSQADMLQLRDGTCSGTVTCMDYTPPCRDVNGVEVCEPTHHSDGITETLASWDAFTSDIPQMCWEVEAVFNDCVLELDCIGNPSCIDSCDHLPPELQAECLAPPCWVDAQGDTHCLDSTVETWANNLGDPGWVDNCEEFLVDPECVLLPEMTCIEGMEHDADPTDIGLCYARSRFFDCGTSVTVPGVPGADDVDTTCGAAMRCLGDECANAAPESNPDFMRAVAAATTISESTTDMECSIAGDPSSCVLFQGSVERCKDPRGFTLGLIPDCCKESRKAGRSAGDFTTYMMLARHTYTLAKDPHVAAYLSQSAIGSSINTIVDTPGEWGRSAGRVITSGFNSALEWAGFNPIGGASSAGALAADTAASVTKFGPIQQYIAQGVHDFFTSIGHEVFADSLFATTAEGMVTDWAASGLGQMIGSVLTVIGLIYTIYKILQILGSLLFPCEEEELAFGLQQANRACRYIGKYCAKRVRIAFVRKCIIDKETYCCFSSPFGRILNEQLRLQGIGPDWGTARVPNCDGVSIGDLETVDWSLVDLSEWEAILFEAGLVPDPRNPPLNYIPTHRHPGAALGGSEGTTATDLMEQQIEVVMPYFDTHRPDLETAPLFQPDPELLPWYDDGGP